MGIIARNSEKTIKTCVESFVNYVDQCVVVLAGESIDKTEQVVKKLARKYPSKFEFYNFEWIDDFAAARNYCFSKLRGDFLCWVDADDHVKGAENIPLLANQMPDEVGGIWFRYDYAHDEFNNVTTVYERERLLRSKYGWIWRSRLHETVSPLKECRYVRSGDVVIVHNHVAGASRSERNFRILFKMLEESPEDKRVWLYLGHQYFADQQWMNSAEWYLKFGTDKDSLPLERFQALCYCSKALREMGDPQCVEVAHMAVALYPEFKDGYLELAHSYLRAGDLDKAIHYAKLSEVKELIKEPPTIIFVNPLEYSFNRLALLAECYLKKSDLSAALEYMKEAWAIRPTPEVKQNIAYIEGIIYRNKVSEAIKLLSIHLLNNREIVKLPHLLEITPYWFRETEDFTMLTEGVRHYTKDLESKPEIMVDELNNAIANVANAFNLTDLLIDLDKKHDKVTVVCPYPIDENAKQINILSQTDMEKLIMTKEGRHILNLHTDEHRIVCEYDKEIPTDLSICLFLGRGLEHWSPKTIKEIGCGGSETAAAMMAHELAKRNCQPVVYAMDNEIWNGVVYRFAHKFNPAYPHHLFVSSRVPEIFNNQIQAVQKWLWMHDIHCWDKLTPDIASQIDAIICLSQWHLNHVKRAYPFLKEADVINMDKHELTYEDLWTPAKFYENEPCHKLPKMVILGDATDTSRFQTLTEQRVSHRFIWLSSPDRGLEELLVLFPMIREKLPDATLKIFYGWNYFDSSLWIPAQREFKERIRTLIRQPGVEWCNRVGQDQLAKELMQADALIYPPPHQFRETYGIAFLEAQAAGVLVFYRQNGALGETVGKRGIPLPMDMSQENIVNTVVSTLSNKEKCDRIRVEAREWALQKDWREQAKKMLLLYKFLTTGEPIFAEGEMYEQDNFNQGGGSESP